MGYSNCYPNTAIDGFKSYLNRSLTERGQPMTESLYTWLWSAILNVWFIGFAIGTWIAVPVTDSLGRKSKLSYMDFNLSYPFQKGYWSGIH